MKQHTSAPAQQANMTEEALSRRLGRLQRVGALAICVAILAVLSCVVVLLFFQQKILGALLFAVAAVGILIGSSMQKKKKALIHDQLGASFRAERERVFGADPQTPELSIDEAWLRASRLTGRVWERCEIRNFHEGMHRGLRFSAANVILLHVYETNSGQEGPSTHTTNMFDGIVIRCRTAFRAPARVYVRERIEPDEPDVIRTSSAAFNQQLIATCDNQSAALGLLTPQFLAALEELEKNFRDKLSGLIWEDDTLTLAFNTKYVFADVPDELDARDIDALRKWYTASLNGMCFVLDTLRDKAPVFQPEE